MGGSGGLGFARVEVVRLPGGDGLWVVRAEGPLEGPEHAALEAATRPAAGCTAVVIDLALVPRVSAAGVRALVGCARTLEERGSRLLLATADATGGEVLATEGALTVVRSVAEAATACGGPGLAGPGPGPEIPSPRRPEQAGAPGLPGRGTLAGHTERSVCAGSTTTRSPAVSAPPEELLRLRTEVRHLRAKARTHPLISRAQGVLEERYRLPDDSAAFALLEASSQRFNVRLRTLAAAVVTIPAPRTLDGEWFPGRKRLSAPPLAFAPGLRAASANATEVLSAVLRRSMEVAETGMGNVQLVDPVTGDLRIEKHHGLDDDFLEFFDRVGKDGTSCAQASQQVTRVTVTDVATDTVFDEPSRAAILAAGSRGCHSTPLVVPSGQVEGVVSTHHERPVRALSASQARALDEVGSQTGRWLEWYHRTVVLDALEDLHFAGSTWR
ncbi:ANTAR domain-containing protein [Streptomyces oryzae]|uniref:ANTAR domain-containing protein n=1 Tax=Streptomyces oryzae TaxID=1434886 RepID=A0ABS3XJZ7_9ACTN|nr:ANTAR domain-containing protein [Streptomyces oryzae]MBO8195735.1 ANTAR domain-containing protein [Streptomyces oryzae]